MPRETLTDQVARLKGELAELEFQVENQRIALQMVLDHYSYRYQTNADRIQGSREMYAAVERAAAGKPVHSSGRRTAA